MTERARVLKVGGGLLGLIVVVLVLGFVILNRGDGQTTPRTSSSPSPTPTDVHAQIEAAYLHAWDVWADALLRLDPSRLQEVLTGNALTKITAQVETQKRKNQPVRIRVEHNYSIVLIDSVTASVDDRFVNHNVRLDPKTGQPIEKDPNQRVRTTFTMRLVNGTWKIAEIIEFR